jgi:hypothetical protein
VKSLLHLLVVPSCRWSSNCANALLPRPLLPTPSKGKPCASMKATRAS